MFTRFFLYALSLFALWKKSLQASWFLAFWLISPTTILGPQNRTVFHLTRTLILFIDSVNRSLFGSRFMGYCAILLRSIPPLCDCISVWAVYFSAIAGHIVRVPMQSVTMRGQCVGWSAFSYSYSIYCTTSAQWGSKPSFWKYNTYVHVMTCTVFLTSIFLCIRGCW